MEDTDISSNCSESSKTSELLPWDLSTLSGLSGYEDEFLDLKRLVNPLLCSGDKVLKKQLRSSIKENGEYLHLSNEFERTRDMLYERIEYLMAQNKQLELNVSAANKQIQRLLNTCSINKNKNFETTLQSDRVLQLEITNNELIKQNSSLSVKINQYSLQKNELQNNYEFLKCQINDLKLELQVKENCIKKLKEKISQQHVELQRLSQDRVQLFHSLDVLSNELQCKSKSEDWYKHELHKLQNYKTEWQAIKSEHEEKIILLEKNIEQLSLELNKWKCTCEELRLISLKEKEKTLKQFEHDNGRLSGIENFTTYNVTYDIDRVTNHYENLIDDLNNDIKRMERDFECQQQMLKNALSENFELQGKHSSLQNFLREKEIAMESIENNIKGMAQKLKTSIENQTEQNEKLLHSNKMCVNLKIELDNKKFEKENVEQSIQHIKEQFKLFKSKYTNLKSDLHKKNKEFLRVLNEKQELDIIICDMRKMLEKQLDEIEFLKKEIACQERNTNLETSQCCEHLAEIQNLKKEISILKEKNDGFNNHFVNFPSKSNPIPSTSKDHSSTYSSLDSDKEISFFDEDLEKTSFVNLLKHINKIFLPEKNFVSCVEHYNFSITDKQKNYLKTILNAVLMRLRFAEQEILSKTNRIQKQKKTISDLNQIYLNRLEKLESRCGLLWQKNEDNTKILDSLHHSRSKRTNDEVNHLRTILEVKVQKEREKQKQYEKNYRTLLKKVKEHMKGRSVAENHSAYLSKLNRSIAEKYNTLELEFDLKDNEVKNLQSCIENYSHENEKLKLTVLDTKKKMSVSETGSMFTVLDLLNRSKEEFLRLVKSYENSSTSSSELTIWKQLVEEKQQLISELTSIQKSDDSIQSEMESYAETSENKKLKSFHSIAKDEKSQDIYLENQQGLNLSINKKSNEMENSITSLEQQLDECKYEIDRMKTEKFFLQRLCSDLKFALKVHISHNKALKEHVTTLCRNDEKVTNLVILTKFPTPNSCTDDKINELLQASVTSSRDLQEYFNSLKNGFLFLQKQISAKNFGF